MEGIREFFAESKPITLSCPYCIKENTHLCILGEEEIWWCNFCGKDFRVTLKNEKYSQKKMEGEKMSEQKKSSSAVIVILIVIIVIAIVLAVARAKKSNERKILLPPDDLTKGGDRIG